MKEAISNDEVLFDVYWEIAGPLDAPTLQLTSHHVLYMLLGHHALYGSRQLLYIGRTSRIGRRLAEHRKWAELESDTIETRIASVGHFHTWSDRDRDPRTCYDDETGTELLNHVEALLVYAHQPAYNSHLLRAAPQQVPRGGSIRLFNTGRYAPLLPELSTRRYRDIPRIEL